jgi:hypothetical protein
VGNIARKIIQAVQNTMLDKLFLRLIPFWGVAVLWDGGKTSEISIALFLLAGLVFFVAWSLGAFALLKPPTGRSALQRLHDTPENGLEVWSHPPEGGIRPPRIMRVFVRTLGVGDSGPRPEWFSVLTVALFVPVAVFTVAVATKPPEFWRDAPWLAIPSNRVAILGGATIVVVAFVVRNWASEQRALLENRPSVRPSPSRLVDYAVFVAISGAIAAAAVIWWNAQVSIALAATIGIAVAGLLPFLPTKIMEILFGKRVQEPPPGR